MTSPRPQAKRTLAPQEAPGIYAPKFDWALAKAIIARILAGESLRSICRADPRMPTEKTVWNWRRAHPAFESLMTQANATARAASLQAQASRDAGRRAAKAAARRDRGFRPFPAFATGYSAAMADAICDRLILGEALTAICRDPDMPCVGTVYNWLRRYPEFVEQYRQAKVLAADFLTEQAIDVVLKLSPRRSGRRVMQACDRRIAQLALTRYG